jgi:hypothetical protein
VAQRKLLYLPFPVILNTRLRLVVILIAVLPFDLNIFLLLPQLINNYFQSQVFHNRFTLFFILFRDG